MAGDAGPKLVFRADGLDVESAVEQPVDDGSDERGAVHRVTGPLPDVTREAIEAHDLSIEQHHGHLGPLLGVNGWTPTARLVSTPERLPWDPLRDHRERV